MKPIITLTTDFGIGSPYVAQMKGVILSICRDADVIDVCHSISPQNIREGAIVLADATPRFPPGTIHVAVVDPGVGTSRRIIYVEVARQRYVAPDNGLLSLLARHSIAGSRQKASDRPNVAGQICSLENPTYWLPQPSATFHGRDILAPAAAHLARGLDPAALGPPCETMISLDWPVPQVSTSRIAGEVLYVDSFGNLITNIHRDVVTPLGDPGSIAIDCGGRQIHGIVPTYAAALPGEVAALYDSQGRLEIAKVAGSAAKDLHIAAGESVVVASRP